MLKECNFKFNREYTDKGKALCHIKSYFNTYSGCDGEENCVLWKIYSKLK